MNSRGTYAAREDRLFLPCLVCVDKSTSQTVRIGFSGEIDVHNGRGAPQIGLEGDGVVSSVLLDASPPDCC